jgi:hypothetical protein
MSTEPTAPKLTAEQIKACQQNDVPMGLLVAKCSPVAVWLERAYRAGMPLQFYWPAHSPDESGWLKVGRALFVETTVYRVSPDYQPAKEPDPPEEITVYRIASWSKDGRTVEITETYGADGHLLNQTAKRFNTK